jgi:glucan phosphoethanolaminetransferase (alkaline phosphatase superfamily)
MGPERSSVNYLYFGTFFLVLVILAAGSIFTKESLGGSRIFFFLYALGQATLEIILLMICAHLLRRYRFAFFTFIGLTFVALFIHLFDFLMERVLDQTVWEALSIFVLNESFENFLYLLDASGIPLWAWGIIFVLLVSLPFLGALVYKLSEQICLKKPVPIRHPLYLQLCLYIPAALFFWDFSASHIIEPDAYSAFTKSLPWKYTFLRPNHTYLSLNHPLKKPQFLLGEDHVVLSKKPNIYLFVVESLREDAINPLIAPHLASFRRANVHFDTALSNGNGTHLSWFSIFYSQFSCFWKMAKESWHQGSPPLELLRRWGYQVRLYTSAQLGYYGMGEVLFGKNYQLVDSYQTFHHAPPLSAADADAEALATLQKDLKEHPEWEEGQIFLIFLDCTHFDYSWPKNWTPKFKNFAREFAYFQAFHSNKTIDQIKNRYKNAVNYMDHLFGKFMKELPRKEEAIVIFTGDHGEEFFEHGHLFHNSHLTQEQIHVPLYFKFGNQMKPVLSNMVSQMDIFPSLFDHIAGRIPKGLEGSSIFRERSWPYIFTSRFNAGSTPYEFSIHNGAHKLIAQFSDRSQILNANELKIVSLRTANDRPIPEFKKSVDVWINREFGPALERLFPQEPLKGH